ncbi:hypothetical protein SDC9_168105 [bioreactor metagenome]|uniref:Uncharacterized protein n=1 Tax=bioreactor metagenome TaxID=1076179 RepID=A0A645G3L8_9ZZZZ
MRRFPIAALRAWLLRPGVHRDVCLTHVGAEDLYIVYLVQSDAGEGVCLICGIIGGCDRLVLASVFYEERRAVAEAFKRHRRCFAARARGIVDHRVEV